MKNVLAFIWILLIACTNKSEIAANPNSIVPKSATAEEFVKIWNDHYIND